MICFKMLLSRYCLDFLDCFISVFPGFDARSAMCLCALGPRVL